MKTFKKFLRIIGKIALAIILFFSCYAIAAFSLSRITVNSEAKNQSKDVTIFILTNGVHTDLVLPVKNAVKDWRNEILFENTKAKDTTAQFIAFGWGDKGFYLNTPEWSDLKASTAFNAAFGLSTTAMHTTFYKSLQKSKTCIPIELSTDNYQKLVDYIESGFQHDAAQMPIFINAVTYGKNDSFYEANGSYSLFQTCNSWANAGLKAANQKAALWTITDTGIFCHYQ